MPVKDVYLAAYLQNSGTAIILPGVKIPVGEAGEDAVVPCVLELELWQYDHTCR